MKKDLSRAVIFGDSLSDSGNMKDRRLFGLFPIPGTGLDKSGDGRFADGLVWPGFFALYWADKIFNKAIKDDNLRKQLWKQFVSGLTKPENEVDILQHHLIRNYAEGGATAATYKILDSLREDIESLSKESIEDLLKDIEFDVEHPEKLVSGIADSVKKLGAQGIVINLAIEREKFFQDEEKILKGKTPEDAQKLKDETLVTVWTGANDLITVNKNPTKEEADKAINAIIHHVSELEKNGYSQFYLFNLPDLTKTPFYQKQLAKGEISAEELDEIRQVITYFNDQLEKRCATLESKPKVFDVYSKFDQVYNNPESYGFDPAKRTSPLSDDPSWKPEPGIEPAADTDAMFWNDVHPTSKLQSIICKEFLDELQETYSLDNNLEAITKVAQQKNQSSIAKILSAIFTPIANFLVTIWNFVTGLLPQSNNQPVNGSQTTDRTSTPITSSFGNMIRLAPELAPNPSKDDKVSKVEDQSAVSRVVRKVVPVESQASQPDLTGDFGGSYSPCMI